MDSEGLKELFEPFGAVAVKRMFGGHSVYLDELIFCLAFDGEVYLKTDGETESAFAAARATHSSTGPFASGEGRLLASRRERL